MTPVFADTFFFLALVSRKDPRVHELATQAHHAGRPVVTTAWVLVELADHLCEIPNRPVFERLYAALISTPQVEIVPRRATEARGTEACRRCRAALRIGGGRKTKGEGKGD